VRPGRLDDDLVPALRRDPVDERGRGTQLGAGERLLFDEGVVEVQEDRLQRAAGGGAQGSVSSTGCSTTATTRVAMKRAVRTARPDRVT